MELATFMCRPRFWSRYLHILLSFSVLSVFLLFFHQLRPRGHEFVSEMILTSWSGSAREVGADSTTGVLPIVFPHKDKRCSFTGSLEGIVPELPVGRARYDNRRLLRIYDYIRIGNEWEDLSSLDRIYWLPQVLEKWRGPLSLAVHITSEEEWLVLNLYTRFLERCFPAFRDQVSVHLALPASLGPFCFDEDKIVAWNITNFEEVEFQNQCHEPKEYMQFLMDAFPTTHKDKLALKEVYPQNHMRNIARKACGTDWTYSTDVDIIPRDGMAEMLQAFYDELQMLSTPCKKCAFVIPTFELDEGKSFPKTKHDIVHYFRSGAARQFHGRIFDTGHKATNYNLWATVNIEDGPVKVSHKVINSQTYLYEPFYVSSDSIPPFDERFLGYGFTRNSQFQEALYAGWNFSVLTPVFSVHWGLQSPKTLLFPKKQGIGKNVRQEQTSANSKLFNKILKEMKLKKQEGIF
ncbi:Beta-1,4-glucuronyltransferase 1 [Orchesella cincta]|uniref:Beta-1,4-glucuronyltransferase 1 n=1 Tax=Orchesella cincta TaxID=48709 RepID=A0A1D2N7A9_ORCCI|nr:Beta-1,4-glucuronyltransferase 1 [Orchesella cincta]